MELSLEKPTTPIVRKSTEIKTSRVQRFIYMHALELWEDRQKCLLCITPRFDEKSSFVALPS
jgi:hypothetical protein